jgi:hypothetical protein
VGVGVKEFFFSLPLIVHTNTRAGIAPTSKDQVGDYRIDDVVEAKRILKEAMISLLNDIANPPQQVTSELT